MKPGLRSLPRARAGRLRDRLQSGQAVEVSRGALTGLSGVLLRCRGGSRWTVRLDGLRGVVLEVDAVALKPRGPRQTRN